jgi:hypothetical protein
LLEITIMSPLLNFIPDDIRLSKRSNLRLLMDEDIGNISNFFNTINNRA